MRSLLVRIGFVGAVGMPLIGCSLITKPERDEIDDSTGGTGSSVGGSGGTTSGGSGGSGGTGGVAGSGGTTSGGSGGSGGTGGVAGSGGMAGSGGSTGGAAGTGGSTGGAAGSGGSTGGAAGTGGSTGGAAGSGGSTGGAAGTGGSATGGTGGTGGCTTASECPGQDNACQTRTCSTGACGMSFVTAGPAPQQVPSDCKKVMCDGAGTVSSQNDDADPVVDGNQCTDDLCSNGTPSNPNKTINSTCTQNGGKFCTGAGVCVECNSSSQCASLVCNTTAHTCNAPTCSDGVKNGTETGVDCGGTCPLCPTVLAVVGSATAVLGADLVVGGSWSTTSLGSKSVDGVSLVSVGGAGAAAAVRFTEINHVNDQALQYSAWTPSGWTQLANVGTGITTQSRPALAVGPTAVHLAFHGTDDKHYFISFAGTFSAPEAIGPSGNHQYGPSGADLTVTGSTPVAVYASGEQDGALSSDDRVSAVWQSPQFISGAVDYYIVPAVVALSSGPELLVVFAENQTGNLLFTTRTSGVWTTPAAITGASTGARPSLAALPGGGAALAFKGTDGKLYTSFFSGSSWSGPAGISSPNVNSTSSPAITRGAATAAVEVAFIESDGVAYHSRLISSTWTTPAAIGGSAAANVAITTLP
jgi:hypothetical protein